MPELPEVETVRQSLLQHVKGLKIVDVKVFHDNMIKDDDFVE